MANVTITIHVYGCMCLIAFNKLEKRKKNKLQQILMFGHLVFFCFVSLQNASKHGPPQLPVAQTTFAVAITTKEENFKNYFRMV